ncbi:DNA recombination protein RmuC [Paracoccaceae bacterium]|nr:DNA recombination protein RmuC [Paracoccaceae bacterium]
MTGVDPEIFILSIGVLAIIGCLVIARQFLSSDKNGKDDSKALQETLRDLSANQQQIVGSIKVITDTQTTSQAAIIKHVESRLEEIQNSISSSLSGSSVKTAQTLGELQQRLQTIDKAQTNIEKLSGEVLGLQEILSNKQARGIFGEIQLKDIVSKALPADAYDFQFTLSNGKRADCIIYLPEPQGNIVIDSKFPLESYNSMITNSNEVEKNRHIQLFQSSIKTHIKDISEKYIIEGETADGAILFLPSEAIYAELHANFSKLVNEGFESRVWIVSPTTLMATLNTMRAILKDERLRRQTSHIRSELDLLYKDMMRLEGRIVNLDKHFNLASRDVDEIKVSAKKASKRVFNIERFEFDELTQSQSEGEGDPMNSKNVLENERSKKIKLI